MTNLIELSADAKPTRADIERLQGAMATMPQCETMVTDHFFADGMYARRVWRPAGTVIVGKVHKKEHFFTCTKGLILVWTESGVRELKAGDVVVTTPGTKRVTYSVEDSIGMTVHRTDSKDLNDIEAEVIEADESALFDASNAIKELMLEKNI